MKSHNLAWDLLPRSVLSKFEQECLACRPELRLFFPFLLFQVRFRNLQNQRPLFD